MLHVVTAENRSLYEPQVEESFLIRHKIYVEERGWRDLERPDRREVDQFDNDDAIYLLALDERTRRVVGGSRLIPTLKPHLMSDVFPQLASVRQLPRSRDIYEWTRFYVISERREPHAISDVACTIMCGVQEYCLANGVAHLSIVTEPFWIPRFARLGWNPMPLGLPTNWQGMDVVGITVDITESALLQTRQVRDFSQSVLVHENAGEGDGLAVARKRAAG
jgi:acyl-homoserine lactone synthase